MSYDEPSAVVCYTSPDGCERKIDVTHDYLYVLAQGSMHKLFPNSHEKGAWSQWTHFHSDLIAKAEEAGDTEGVLDTLFGLYIRIGSIKKYAPTFYGVDKIPQPALARSIEAFDEECFVNAVRDEANREIERQQTYIRTLRQTLAALLNKSTTPQPRLVLAPSLKRARTEDARTDSYHGLVIAGVINLGEPSD